MKKKYIINYEKKKTINYLENSFKKITVGSIVLVLYRYKYLINTLPLIRQFFGICISKNSKYRTSTLIVRNVLDKEGVEILFNILSPNVLSLKKIKMSKGVYVRNKLYYLRNRIAWESTILDKTIFF